MTYLQRPDIAKAIERSELIVLANSISPQPNGTHRSVQTISEIHVKNAVRISDIAQGSMYRYLHCYDNEMP
jgi:hypothetical protein